MCPFTALKERLKPLKSFSEQHLLPLVLLLARLKIGSVFLEDGWFKFGYVLHGQTDTFYSMFEDYKVPLFSPHAAAWTAMLGELIFGLLLTLGLCGRLGALGLILISGVIIPIDGNPLVYWALLCAIILSIGPGKWSLDRLICTFKNKGNTHETGNHP